MELKGKRGFIPWVTSNECAVAIKTMVGIATIWSVDRPLFVLRAALRSTQKSMIWLVVAEPKRTVNLKSTSYSKTIGNIG